MAKRRTSKKKIRKQVISAVIVVILAILAYFLEPWQYITGEEKPDVGSRTEITSTDLQIHYIDVGQADSILVRVPVDGGMKNMLIDAGTAENYPASNIIDYLSELGISSLDYFVITHPHLDHIGAADEVIHTFDVKTVIIPADNVKDLEEIDQTVRGALQFVPAEHVDTVLAQALVHNPENVETDIPAIHTPVKSTRTGLAQ